MLGSNDATTLAEEFKRSQDIINKELVAMTEQMAEITQSLKAAYSKPTADGFGLTAMASAGINVAMLVITSISQRRLEGCRNRQGPNAPFPDVARGVSSRA